MTQQEWLTQLEACYRHVAAQALAQTDAVDRVRLWDECVTLARQAAELAEQDGAVETARSWRRLESAARSEAAVTGDFGQCPE